MSLINRAGTFRGSILDSCVSSSTGGFPQFVIMCNAAEYYDEEIGEWVGWDVDENELTAYLVLFDGKDRKTLNCKQVEKVFGWDGLSFEELDNLDASEIAIQFRIKESVYQGNTNYQVEWIDEYDATPGRVTRKLEPAELKALQARYAKLLKGNTTKTKAPATKTKPPTAPGRTTKKKDPPKAPPTTAPPKRVVGSTKEEAWNACVELKAKGITDEQLSTIWVESVEKTAPNKTDEQIIPEEWTEILNLVLDKAAMF